MQMPTNTISKGLQPKGFEKSMGLAASQARFLGLTARKANCEFKSTELAEEKLNLSNQMSQISNDYFNALNATKLTWQNEVVEGTFGVSYGLLMTPSALNDYNPYMVTTKSGAVVLTNEFINAAKAAGINMNGGTATQEGRDKFINALIDEGIITPETAKLITIDEKAVKYENGKIKTTQKDDKTVLDINNEIDKNYILWNSTAGVGGPALNKNEVDGMSISDLMYNDSIGKTVIEWDTFSTTPINGSLLKQKYEAAETEAEKRALELYYGEGAYWSELTKKQNTGNVTSIDENKKYTPLSTTQYYQTLTEYDKNIKTNKESGNQERLEFWEQSKQYFMKLFSENESLLKTDSTNITTTAGQYSLIKNGAIVNSQSTLNNMTIANLLSDNIILMVRNKNESDQENLITTNDFADSVLNLMRPIFECLGLGDSKKGLNIDDAADEALDYAYRMIRNVYLRAGNAVKLNNETSNESVSKNSAYQNAIKNNRIGQDEKGIYSAVSLSNIMSAFLTYFDNYVMGLKGAASNFSVAKTVDLSSYVTENSGYIYYGQSQNGTLTTEEKTADFYDELYNNICRHGWREDDTISNDENLSAAIKDGRYVLSVLHDDGYFYQTNYVNLDYLVEVADKEAIARAEAEFTRKKAEITSKENAIDIKAKKLDAEIAELTSELNSVQNLIQEGASVFKQFQS